MSVVIVVSDSESEASLKCFNQFLDLKKKLRLSSESVREASCMVISLKWRIYFVLLNSFAIATRLILYILLSVEKTQTSDPA